MIARLALVAFALASAAAQTSLPEALAELRLGTPLAGEQPSLDQLEGQVVLVVLGGL